MCHNAKWFADENGETEITYNNGICSVCNGADPNYTPDSPETGDNRMAHLWFVLLTVSVLGIVAVTIKSKSYR